MFQKRERIDTIRVKENRSKRGGERGVGKKKERQSCALKDPKPCLKESIATPAELRSSSLSLSLPAPLASYYSRDVCSDDCVMESDGKTNRDHIGGLSFQREPFAFQMRSSVL